MSLDESLNEICDPESKATPGKIYPQKYRPTWEMEFKGWLQGVPSNPCQAFCRLCNLTLKAHYGIISRHSKGPSHIERAKTEGLVIPLTNFVVKTNETKEQKKAELKLAET